MISSKLLIGTLFSLSLFCSYISPQGKNTSPVNESDFRNLEYLKKKITEWKSKDFKNIYADQIIDTISLYAASQPNLRNIYQKAHNRFRLQMDDLNRRIKSQQSTDAVEFAYEHIRNKIKFDNQYYDKYLNISGVVYNINRDMYGTAFVLINPDVKCIFPDFREYEVNSLSIGDLPIIRGRYTGAVPKGNGYLMIMEDCHIVKEADLTKLQKKIWTDVESFVNSFATALDDEIKLQRTSLVEYLYSEGLRLSEKKDYNAALAELQKISQYTNSNKDSFDPMEKLGLQITNDKAQKLIEGLGFQISYDKAQALIGKGDLLNAYLLLFEPAYKSKGVENSIELFQANYSRYYEEQIQKARLEGSIEKYTAAFDSLAKYSKYDHNFFQALFRKWQPEFSEFAAKYYKGDIRKYKTVPGGSYFNSLIRSEIEVGSFLISSVEIDRQFLKALRYSTSADISERLASQTAEEVISRITQWLGLRFLTSNESEYIETDGWKSKNEKDLFCNGLINYKIIANPKTLCISLKDIKNPDDRKYLSDVIDRQTLQIRENISKEKEMTYSAGKVRELNRVYLMPRLSYLYTFNDWSYNQDIRFYQNRSDLALGVFIGYNFAHDLSKKFHPFNGIGINLQYITNMNSSNSLYPLGNKIQNLDENSYKHQGFEAEIQYRPLLTTNSIVLGLGYIQLKSDYTFRFKGETTSYSAHEDISAISVTLGVAANSFTDMSVLLFMKSYFSIQPKGQYSFSSNLTGNFILGISLDYQIPFLRYEPERF